MTYITLVRGELCDFIHYNVQYVMYIGGTQNFAI
jgi:hypothetical protein